MENLFETYRHADQRQRDDLTDQIIAEIRKIKRKNKKVLRASAERPVSMGGLFRSGKKEKSDHSITRYSIKITAKEFFSKTFTIGHE